MSQFVKVSLSLNLLVAGAAFGILYAWVFTVMWGLDAAEPRTAVRAMVSMNEQIKNGFFLLVFMGAPVFMWVASGVCRSAGSTGSAWLLGAAGLVYFFGVLGTTAAVNVPMNEALAAMSLPLDEGGVAEIWSEFSPRWQRWNQLRAVAAGLAFALSGLATFR